MYWSAYLREANELMAAVKPGTASDWVGYGNYETAVTWEKEIATVIVQTFYSAPHSPIECVTMIDVISNGVHCFPYDSQRWE